MYQFTEVRDGLEIAKSNVAKSLANAVKTSTDNPFTTAHKLVEFM